MIQNGVFYNKQETSYFGLTNDLINFIVDFYDDREETEKDIWYSKNIKGARVPASGTNSRVNGCIDFTKIPIYYRDTVKRYFMTIITKKSWNHCVQILTNLKYFFEKFYSNGYNDGFIENLSRNDIENYLYWLGNDYKDKNPTYRCKFASYVRTFLEYTYMAQYDKTSKTKDIIIAAKDKRIRELEEENKKLKEQLKILRGKLYEKM